MKSDGAQQPHHGAPAVGCSPGVRKYRDKRCESHFVTGVSALENSENNRDKNNSNRSSGHQSESESESGWNCSGKIANNFKNDIHKSGNIGVEQQQQTLILTTRQPQQQGIESVCKDEKTKVLTAFDYTSNSIERNNLSSIKTSNQDRNRVSTIEINAVAHKDVSAVTDGTCNRSTDAAIATSLTMVVAAMVFAVSNIAAAISSSAAARAKMSNRSSGCVAAGVMRMQQFLLAATTAAKRVASTSTNARLSKLLLLCLLYAAMSLPTRVYCDDGDNFFAVNSFSMGPETTTPEFDYASRGQKKYGDKCENTLECGFPGSICDPKKKSCQCTEDLPVTNHIDKCGKEAAVNESCFFNEQCEVRYFQTECRDGRCVCRFEMTPVWGKDGSVECKGRQEKRTPETYIDPAMIGVLVGMALMFVIICVVLRLFSQARWRENRTIFNTPNPRLMNVSLLRDSKLLHGQERRGSRMSVRAPSRQPSMASLRPHSPNPSLGKTGSRSGSHGSGNSASATSLRSTRSNSVAPGNVMNSHHERKASAYQSNRELKDSHGHHHQQPHPQQPLMTNITANPVAESVTVEIIEPEK